MTIGRQENEDLKPKSITDALQKNLSDYLTRREGDKPVAPAAPLVNRESKTPLQDSKQQPVKR